MLADFLLYNFDYVNQKLIIVPFGIYSEKTIFF